MQYEYLATQPDLPPGATSPRMDDRQMTDWLNALAARGWEFVGYGQKWWHNTDTPQDWWVFRKPKAG
jgi:hypothetical protein